MTKEERLSAIKAIAKRNRKRRAMSGNRTASQARAEVIARVDQMRLPPLPRRSDTRAINWAAIHEVECPDCGAERYLESGSSRQYVRCVACRARMAGVGDAPVRIDRAQAVEDIAKVLTGSWQTVSQIARRLGILGGNGWMRVREMLARMRLAGDISGCSMQVGGRGKVLLHYRRRRGC